MKTCTNCSISYPDDKKFCKVCGNLLVSETMFNAKDMAQKSVIEDKLKANPLDIPLLREYAQFLFNKLMFKESITVLLKILAIDEKDIFAPELLFKSYLQIEIIKDAAEIGEKLLANKPDDLFLLSNMVDVCIKTDKDFMALVYLDRIIAINPKSREDWIKKATLLSKNDNEKETLNAWQKVYELDPNNIMAKMYIGIDACKTSNFKKACELLEPIISMFEKDEDKNTAMFFYSYASLKTKGIDSGISTSIKKIYITPFFNSKKPEVKQMLEELLVLYGTYCLEQNCHDDAIYYFDNAFQLTKSEANRKLLADALYNFATNKFETGEIKLASENIHKALKHYSDDNNYKSLLNKINGKKKKKRRKIILISASMVVLAIIIIVCSVLYASYKEQETTWKEAKNINSRNLYLNYINLYPNGRYVAEAKQNIKKIEDDIAAAEQARLDAIAAAEKAKQDERYKEIQRQKEYDRNNPSKYVNTNSNGSWQFIATKNEYSKPIMFYGKHLQWDVDGRVHCKITELNGKISYMDESPHDNNTLHFGIGSKIQFMGIDNDVIVTVKQTE